MTKEEVIIQLGLDNAALKTGLAGSDWFVKNSVQATMNSLKNLVRINAVSLAIEIGKLWDDVSKKAAEAFFGGESAARRAPKLDEQRNVWHKANQERWAEEERLRKQEEKNARDRIKRAALEGENINTQREIQLEAIADEEKREQMRLKFQNEDLKYLREQINYRDDIVTTAEKTLEVSKKEQQIAQTNARLAEIRSQKERDILAAKQQSASASSRLQGALAARTQFTLEEMAGADVMQGTRWGMQAQEILQLRDWAQQNSMLGFGDLSRRQMSRADQLFESLRKENPNLIDPLAEMKQDTKRSADALEQMNKGGVNIKPRP